MQYILHVDVIMDYTIASDALKQMKNEVADVRM